MTSKKEFDNLIKSGSKLLDEKKYIETISLSDNIIKLFPKEFFNTALKRIFLFIIVISSAILINGIILRFNRKNVHT